MKYSVWVALSTVVLLLCCTKEYPLSEYENFVSQPVLYGTISQKHGINLRLTRTLSPLERDTVMAGVSGANIILVSDINDTIDVIEEEPGIYQNNQATLSDIRMYRIIVNISGEEVVVSEELVLPKKMENVQFDIDRDKVSASELSVTVTITDNNVGEYWYWYRFRGDGQPQFTDLANNQSYDLCEANNYTSSNEIVFSAACSSESELVIGFTSHYLEGREVPKNLELEIVRIERAFGEHLKQLFEISGDTDYAIFEPPSPISNTSIGVGYISPMTIQDTIILLE